MSVTTDLMVAVKAMRAVLLANASFASGVSNQVGFMQVVNGSLPYALIDMNAGTDDNQQGMRLSDLRLLVKVVGLISSAVTLHELSAKADALLHEAMLADADEAWWCWRCQRVSVVNYVEYDAEVAYLHTGGIYRLRLSQ